MNYAMPIGSKAIILQLHTDKKWAGEVVTILDAKILPNHKVFYYVQLDSNTRLHMYVHKEMLVPEWLVRFEADLKAIIESED